jgi:hypothetical protein
MEPMAEQFPSLRPAMTDGRMPRCQDCGAPNPHAVGVWRFTDKGGKALAHEWVCGSCEYLREHPNARPAIAPPREQRPKRLQKESLLDLP